MKEQRKFQRHDVRHLIDFSTTDPQGTMTSFQMGRVLDISQGGLKIETPIDIDVATRVEITAGIGEQLVDIVGLVTHTEQHANRFVSGIQLLSISKEDRIFLTSYIEKTLKSQDGASPLNETMH